MGAEMLLELTLALILVASLLTVAVWPLAEDERNRDRGQVDTRSDRHPFGD